ncbi:MAG: CARDB domain-containing protein [Candidatus Binatia bacterium]
MAFPCSYDRRSAPCTRQGVSGTLTFAVDPPAAAGTYHVLVVTDSRGELGESNETDNVFAVGNTITVNCRADCAGSWHWRKMRHAVGE